MEILNPRSSRIAKKRRVFLSVQNSGLEKIYPSSLTLYADPPTDIITLQNLDELAVERLQLLRAIERAGTMSDWEKSVQTEVGKAENLRPYLKLETPSNVEHLEPVLEARRRDYLSHFVLRLAYCRSDSLRWWFISQEADLFKFRLTRASTEDKRAFLKQSGLKFADMVSAEEKKEKLHHLAEGTSSLLGGGNLYSTAERTNFYRVPFQDALELVRSRRAYLEGGMVYVAEADMNTIILQIFKARMNHALILAGHMLPTWEKDERLKPLLLNFHNTYVGPQYDKVKRSGAKVSLANLHELAEESFPMCMKHLYDVLKTQHHLKHFSRVQFNLFLKGIGLPMEEALQLFRTEFTKGKTEPERFDKKYAYTFRHGYGKEGKRADYRPFSCLKIIQTTPGPQETHGCPFAHFDMAALKSKLRAMKIGEAGIQEIAEINQNKHYQIACGKVFQFTHNLSTNSVGINHPNQYFENSQQLRHGVTQADIPVVKTEIVKKEAIPVKTEASSVPVDGWDEEMLPQAREALAWGLLVMANRGSLRDRR